MRRKKHVYVYLYELRVKFAKRQAAEGDSHGLVHKSQVALMKRGSQFDLDLDAINNMRFCNHRQMLNESFRASGIIAVLRRRTLKRMFLQSEDMLHVVFSWLHIFEPFDIKVSCVQSFWKLQWQSPWKRWKQRSGSWNHSRQRKRLHGKQQLGSTQLWQLRLYRLWGKLPCVLSSAQAVASVRKELKVRKRDHPALFMLGAAGKHIYEAVQAVLWVQLLFESFVTFWGMIPLQYYQAVLLQ